MKVREDTRGYYIKDGKVLVIRCKEKKEGYIDLPGGKIEAGETKEQAMRREYWEETGTEPENLTYRGVLNIYLGDRLYRMNLFLIDLYTGQPHETEEHIPCLMSIEDVLASPKRFACTLLLEPFFRGVLLDLTKQFEFEIVTTEEEIIQEVHFKLKPTSTEQG